MADIESRLFGAGRTPRSGFWLGGVGISALLLLCFLPMALLGGAVEVCSSRPKLTAMTLLMLVPTVLLMRLYGRRLHDVGWPGWLALMVPLAVMLKGAWVLGGTTFTCDIGLLPWLSSFSSPSFQGLPSLGPTVDGSLFKVNGSGPTIKVAAILIPLLLLLGFWPGERGPNRYGVDPIGETAPASPPPGSASV